jgi:hypothetical protein
VGAVCLPDGRRLMIEINQPTQVVNTEGNEMAPSPSEIVALMALRCYGELSQSLVIIGAQE